MSASSRAPAGRREAGALERAASDGAVLPSAMPQRPQLRRAASQLQLSGLNTSSRAALVEALHATEEALSALQSSVESKRAVVSASITLARTASGVSTTGSRAPDELSSRTSDEQLGEAAGLASRCPGELFGDAAGLSSHSSDELSGGTGEERMDDLREAISESDRAVALRLSQFCPADVREDVRRSVMDDESRRRTSQSQLSSQRRSSSGGVVRVEDLGRARAPPPPTDRLQAVCIELVQTEQRYHRDLSLIVHTFVQGLRRVAPGLIQPLVANAEQLLLLHTTLAEKMAAAAEVHAGSALADALGAELLGVSPYLVMYVSYCANFMSGMARLEEGVRSDHTLAKLVVETEAQLTRRNIVERGANSHVSIYAFLIKPVQRLCQYPLLYKEVLKALPADAPAAASLDEGSGKRAGGRLRPQGGAAAPAPSGASGRAKAEYVLAVLEEVAQDVNNKVRQQEERARIVGNLERGGHFATNAVVSAVLGPAAALVLEMRVQLNVLELNDAYSIGERFASWARTLSLQPKRRGTALASRTRPGKLFIFQDRLLLARPSTNDDAFLMLACWPLEEVTAKLGTHGALPTAPIAEDAPAAANSTGGRVLVLSRADERVEIGCAPGEAQKALKHINELQDELLELRKRRARRSSFRRDNETSPAAAVSSTTFRPFC